MKLLSLNLFILDDEASSKEVKYGQRPHGSEGLAPYSEPKYNSEAHTFPLYAKAHILMH